MEESNPDYLYVCQSRRDYSLVITVTEVGNRELAQQLGALTVFAKDLRFSASISIS